MEKIKEVSMNKKKTGDRIIPPHPPLAKGASVKSPFSKGGYRGIFR